ncbi:glycoside hydrolase family 140 protein [Leeuwenhoekiella palythoae]|uniref:glycoside hydrolase family 140 protein n=1 Tax=Leeuwenhoekiella palythoae TaxID=573501 RepID=UPI0035140E49
MKVFYPVIAALLIFLSSCKNDKKELDEPQEVVSEESHVKPIQIADNPHYLQKENGDPFFWLGDTAWLMFSKLNRSEIATYLDDRKSKGFNVIQVMVLHALDASSPNGTKALIDEQLDQPNSSTNNSSYNYWDHMQYAIDMAEERGLYMALVPVWGNNVKSGKVSESQARKYGQFLTERFKNENIIWLNGGDTFGNEYTEVWNTLGFSIKKGSPNLLQTFHPRGRHQSSDWFHNESWLDFNMIQSGHRRYDQDDSEKAYGEDNYKYVDVDFNLNPVKPTIDGEPSYEGIPQGLHDTLQPLWNDNDIRRYGYWSVFAGAAGYTYGHSAIMQFYSKKDGAGAYGNKTEWSEALKAPGAKQMKYLKELMLLFPYFQREPDKDMVVDQGQKYDYVAATKGVDYAMIYTYTGRTFELQLGRIDGERLNAYWYNPRNGKDLAIGSINNSGVQMFNPPGDAQDGNDWVLVLTSK